jgi:pimeloyl-ACP methyl ester carboxylesterase
MKTALFSSLCFTALLALAPAASAADLPDRCADPNGTKCTVSLPTGVTMAYLETGPADGKTVILLHGLTDSVRSWAPAMKALHEADPNLHIYALDQRGHGGSSMPTGANCPKAPQWCFMPVNFAADVVAFMNTMNIGKAVVAGHSMGSMVAQELALDQPSRVEKIILVATSNATKDNAVLRDYVLKEPVMGAWKTALDAKGITSPEAVWNATPRDADPKADDWILKNWDVDPVADQGFVTSIVPETAQVKMGTWIGATSALLAYDNTERLKTLTTPTLVLWGSQDAIFYKSPDQDGIIAALKSSKAPFVWKQYGTVALPQSGYQDVEIGHNVQWDAPQQVAADILSFINTGKPTTDAFHAEAANGAFQIMTDEGKATLVTGN